MGCFKNCSLKCSLGNYGSYMRHCPLLEAYFQVYSKQCIFFLNLFISIFLKQHTHNVTKQVLYRKIQHQTPLAVTLYMTLKLRTLKLYIKTPPPQKKTKKGTSSALQSGMLCMSNSVNTIFYPDGRQQQLQIEVLLFSRSWWKWIT